MSAEGNHEDVRREHGYHVLRVARVTQETADTRSYVLDVPASLASTFAYRAGQFCTFRVRLGDEAFTEHLPRDFLRCYSMSSAPATDAELTVTVKRVPGGVVSNWFNDALHEGDAIEVAKPSGTFCTSQSEHDRPVVAFCGGSGVTPVFSIAKSVLATTARPVRVLYANRDRDSIIFEGAFGALAASSGGRLDVRHHFDSDAGFLLAADVADFVGADLGAEFFICGPTPFMDLVESTLHVLGVDASQIAIERFGAAASPVVDEALPNAADDVTETVTIILKGRKTVVPYQRGDTVLETGRRGGLAPPFSCVAGNCAACMGLVKAGAATMRANNALSAAEVDEGWVLTCQALPVGANVTIEYESF